MASSSVVRILLTAAAVLAFADSCRCADTVPEPNATETATHTPTPAPPPTIIMYNSSGTDTGTVDEKRDSRFLSFSMGSDPGSASSTNVLQEKQDDASTDPSAHLVDIYTDCLMQLSFPCVQRKLLLFLDKLGRMKGESQPVTDKLRLVRSIRNSLKYRVCFLKKKKKKYLVVGDWPREKLTNSMRLVIFQKSRIL